MTTKLSPTEDLSLTRLDPLPELEPPAPLKFPTFQEVVDLEIQQQQMGTESRRLLDLFDGTLSDQTPLIDDFQRHPEKYGEETHELLGLLASGNKSVGHLTPHERRLLNLATLDFHQGPTQPKVPIPARQKATQKPARMKNAPRPRSRINSVPDTQLPAFWWRQ